MVPFLFVYGTLRRASPHPMARFLAERAAFRGLGTVQGTLHDLGRYPGLVESDMARDEVPGEIFELVDPGATLPELDAYEGCAPASPRPWLYERRLTPIRHEDGATIEAWVYFYRGGKPPAEDSR